jgi:hypothetical protein
MIWAGKPRWAEGAEAEVPKKTNSNNGDNSFQIMCFILPYRVKQLGIRIVLN